VRVDYDITHVMPPLHPPARQASTHKQLSK